MATQLKGSFLDNLGKIYAIYTGGSSDLSPLAFSNGPAVRISGSATSLCS
jgi:hypothetical protein